MLGDSFPNRVAASLYGSFVPSSEGDGTSSTLPLGDVLVVDSIREFADTAVRIAASRSSSSSSRSGGTQIGLMDMMQGVLGELIDKESGLFGEARTVYTFIRAMQAIQEVSQLEKHYAHAVFSSSRFYKHCNKARNNVIIL